MKFSTITMTISFSLLAAISMSATDAHPRSFDLLFFRHGQSLANLDPTRAFLNGRRNKADDPYKNPTLSPLGIYQAYGNYTEAYQNDKVESMSQKLLQKINEEGYSPSDIKIYVSPLKRTFQTALIGCMEYFFQITGATSIEDLDLSNVNLDDCRLICTHLLREGQDNGSADSLGPTTIGELKKSHIEALQHLNIDANEAMLEKIVDYEMMYEWHPKRLTVRNHADLEDKEWIWDNRGIRYTQRALRDENQTGFSIGSKKAEDSDGYDQKLKEELNSFRGLIVNDTCKLAVAVSHGRKANTFLKMVTKNKFHIANCQILEFEGRGSSMTLKGGLQGMELVKKKLEEFKKSVKKGKYSALAYSKCGNFFYRNKARIGDPVVDWLNTHLAHMDKLQGTATLTSRLSGSPKQKFQNRRFRYTVGAINYYDGNTYKKNIAKKDIKEIIADNDTIVIRTPGRDYVFRVPDSKLRDEAIDMLKSYSQMTSLSASDI